MNEIRIKYRSDFEIGIVTYKNGQIAGWLWLTRNELKALNSLFALFVMCVDADDPHTF